MCGGGLSGLPPSEKSLMRSLESFRRRMETVHHRYDVFIDCSRDALDIHNRLIKRKHTEVFLFRVRKID